jgi:hypothetical protein
MTLNGITESQRRAAKAVGFVYLFALVPAIFAEFYVPDKLVNLYGGPIFLFELTMGLWLLLRPLRAHGAAEPATAAVAA